MPIVASLPVSTSTIGIPTFVGSPAGSPVTDMSPPTAWTMKS
jgi:hypothetical protein